MRRLALVALLPLACGPATTASTAATEDPPATTGTSDSAGTTSGATTGDPTTGDPTGEPTTGEPTTGEPTTGAPLEPCSCNLDAECPGALNDCAAPAPCGHVDTQSAAATDCVLGLLVAQEFAQFTYCNLCGGFETYEGTFVILGPGQGVDLECHIIDFSQDLRVRSHTIEPPTYFEDCQALDGFKPRRDCLLAGFAVGDTLPMCPAAP